MTFGEALSTLGKQVADTPENEALLAALARTFTAIVTENNAIRQRNEWLTRDYESLKRGLSELESRHRAAQTMAAHWKLQAKGGDYDATKEDGP